MLTQRGVAGILEIFSKDSFFGYFKVEGKAAVVSGGRYRPLTLAMFAVIATSGKSAKIQGVCGMICYTEGIEATDPARKADLLGRAVQYDSRAIAIHPTFKSALLNRGVAYYHLGRHEDVICDQRRLLSIAPDDPAAWGGLEWAYTFSGDPARAAECRARADLLKQESANP
jgi:tetratricopeptide (TPR) repeat protein